MNVADELEAIRKLKARYCRYLDTIESWRKVLATDVVVMLETSVATGRADPRTVLQVLGDWSGAAPAS